jgi:hypothetical protein
LIADGQQGNRQSHQAEEDENPDVQCYPINKVLQPIIPDKFNQPYINEFIGLA